MINLQPISGFVELEQKYCRDLYLTNLGYAEDHVITLPPVTQRPLGHITFLGAESASITIRSVELDKLLTARGLLSSVVIPADVCLGAMVVVTNMNGETWHIASNVPLDLEQVKDM